MPQLIQIASQLNFGAVGSPFGTYTAVVVGAGGKVTIPLGFYYVVTDAGESVQMTQDSGATYETIVPVSSGGMIYSDGYNIQFVGGTGGTGHYALIKGN